MMGGLGMHWHQLTICKQYAPRSRQITTPIPHHSIFTGRVLFLTPNQQSVKALETNQTTWQHIKEKLM